MHDMASCLRSPLQRCFRLYVVRPSLLNPKPLRPDRSDDVQSVREDREGWKVRFHETHGAANLRECLTKTDFWPCERHKLFDEAKIKASFDKTLESSFCHGGIAGKFDPVDLWLLADPTDAVGAFGCVDQIIFTRVVRGLGLGAADDWSGCSEF